MCPLPETGRVNLYVLAISGYFTKCVEVRLPLPDQTAETFAPRYSDQGRSIESRVSRLTRYPWEPQKLEPHLTIQRVMAWWNDLTEHC